MCNKVGMHTSSSDRGLPPLWHRSNLAAARSGSMRSCLREAAENFKKRASSNSPQCKRHRRSTDESDVNLEGVRWIMIGTPEMPIWQKANRAAATPAEAAAVLSGSGSESYTTNQHPSRDLLTEMRNKYGTSTIMKKGSNAKRWSMVEAGLSLTKPTVPATRAKTAQLHQLVESFRFEASDDEIESSQPASPAGVWWREIEEQFILEEVFNRDPIKRPSSSCELRPQKVSMPG